VQAIDKALGRDHTDTDRGRTLGLRHRAWRGTEPAHAGW
jgi:hypothetical protein